MDCVGQISVGVSSWCKRISCGALVVHYFLSLCAGGVNCGLLLESCVAVMKGCEASFKSFLLGVTSSSAIREQMSKLLLK